MNTKLIIGIGSTIGVVLISIAIYSALTNARIARLEAATEKASITADAAVRTVALRETEAAAYKEKIAYLETTLGEIRERADKQDEQLEKITIAGRGARNYYNRARAARSVPATSAELCEKLAALGHPCD
jgi:predicted  nucleic acid-binding Zn-ribbon protein